MLKPERSSPAFISRPSPDFLYIVQFGAHADEQCVRQDKSGHAFHDNNGACNDDRVVAAFDFDGNVFTIFVDGLLGSSNGRGRFETSPDNDIASVADTA